MVRQYKLLTLLFWVTVYSILFSLCRLPVSGLYIIPPVLIGAITGQLISYLAGWGAITRWILSIFLSVVVVNTLGFYDDGFGAVLNQIAAAYSLLATGLFEAIAVFLRRFKVLNPQK